MAGSTRKRKRRAQQKARRHDERPDTEAEPDAEIAALSSPDGGPAPSVKRKPAKRRVEEGPPAPWGSFPLVELMVLIGIVMILAGVIAVKGERGALMVGVGLVLGSLAGLELAVREHFAGYRSHTMLLASVPATITLAALFLLVDFLPGLARAGIGVAVGGLAAWVLTRTFQARSGGYAFRVTKPR